MTKGPWRGWSALWLLGVYTFLAVALLHQLWAHPTDSFTDANYTDTQMDVWWLAWVPHALLHLQDPFVTHTLNTGIGINAGWNTATPLLGLLLAPVTLTLGPFAALLTGLTLGLALSAWSLALVLGRLPVGPALDRGPTALAGLAFGFSPAIVAHTAGHLDLQFLPLVPVIVWLALRLAAGVGRPRTNGLWLGAACAGELLIGEEALVLAIISGAGIALVALRREHWRAALQGLGWALASGLLLGAWPLLDQFFGPQVTHGRIYDPSGFHNDLDGLVTTDPHLIHGSTSEATGFLGWAMLLAIAAGIAVVRNRGALVCFGAAAVGIVLSLGDRLTIDGHRTRLRLPWLLAQDVPLLDHLLPTRWALIVPLFLGAAAAFTLQTVGARRLTWVVVAVALLPWVPSPIKAARFATPRWFVDGSPGIAEGSGVLVLPYPSPSQTQVQGYQAVGGLHFSMPGGYFLGPYDAKGDPVAGGFQLPSASLFTDVTDQGKVDVTDDRRRQLAVDLARWGTSAIVLGPAPHRDLQQQLVTTLLGRGPDETVGEVDIWHHVSPSEVLPHG